METKIENYSFKFNEEENTISVFYKYNLNSVATIRPTKKITTKKEFDVECGYWWLEFRN